MSQPETATLYWGAIDEGIALADAEGVEHPECFLEVIQEVVANTPSIFRASMYYDLTAGRPIELEALAGVLVQLGEKHNLQTPLNFAMYAALKPYVNGTPQTPPE